MGMRSVGMGAYFWYILFSDNYAFFVDRMISFLKHGEGRIYFWYSIIRQFNFFGFWSNGFISHDVFSDTFFSGRHWEHGVGNVGRGARGQYCGDGSMGTVTWGWECGMRAWRWQHGEGNFFLVLCLSHFSHCHGCMGMGSVGMGASFWYSVFRQLCIFCWSYDLVSQAWGGEDLLLVLYYQTI